MSEQNFNNRRQSNIYSKNYLLLSSPQDAQDLVWILNKKIKSEHETQLIKKSFLKLPFFEEMQKYFGEDLLGRLFIKSKVENFNSGDYLLKEGSCSDEMYIILVGKVAIKIQGESQNQREDFNPYQEEMNTQIEKFMNRQDLYKKFIQNRKHQLEENYQKILKRRQELIEENDKRIKEKQEWEDQKIKWGLVVKHQNRRKFSVYSKRENNQNQIDLNNQFIFQKYRFDGISPNHKQGLTINYKGEAVQDNLLKVYTENSSKRGKKKKINEGFQDYLQMVQVRNSYNISLNPTNKEEEQIMDQSPKEKIIKVLEQGEYFGMNSLQENKIQEYSAIALTNVSAAAISKNLFEDVLFSFFEKNLSKEISFLRDISIFQTLKQYELDYIHMQIISKVLEKNAFVYKKGDSSQHLFIVLEGEVEICYVGDEEEKQIIQTNSQKDNLLNQNSPQKREYPVAILGKGAIFGESEILKNSERKSEVKVVSQKAHFYLLPKDYVNILLEKQEFKQELEFQRQLKSQCRKKRLDQLKNIEKEGEIRKNQIKYQLFKLKQTSSTEDCLSTQRKLIQNNSNLLPILPANYTAREINKSQENSARLQKQDDEDNLENHLELYQTVPQKSSNNLDGLKLAMNKFNSIDFNDNRLYDFCQPKFGSVNSVQIHPKKQLPKIQILFDQISNKVDKRSYSYRNTQILQRERQYSQPQIDLSYLNRNHNQNSQLQLSNSNKVAEKDEQNQNQKQNRSISLNNQLPQNSQNQLIKETNKQTQNINNNHNNNKTIDYGYDMPFENVYIKKQLSIQTQNQQNSINNYNLLEQKPQKQFQINDSNKIVNQKRKQSLEKALSQSLDQSKQHNYNNFQKNNAEQIQYQKSSSLSQEDYIENDVINYQIPISSSPIPQLNSIEKDDDLSLQGEAYAYLKKVKKIPDHLNVIPSSPPKIDPLRPKDKQIFVRKPILNKIKKREIKIDKDKDRLPQFFERSIQYQKSVMNMLNYERQRAMIQINYENSKSKQNISKQTLNQ
ncbi:cyclic nucleotide-binding domain protein (macronuclear) [Tetrahymena thermophila SB210]|uniref:Cyclic nucleotide-binding domain protein n=1 Tax=Tetrahymena thermophila (strain SB210) TaxID=312017 RepID=Q236N7_TETTS|nr:cyclic nucleotide-binding domain protein [Tetrahymena thermophila SB210]EAR92463.2 cyclic nucleotide-binding domain protein [Tetrahymena thermophila SB210]|eukprot:XP_001012708.2 cyclic nucleotide-binding domain protein [Tetrahymena thermophila SB210]